jgi:hypothetical protein
VIYRATPQWFIAMDDANAIRDKAMAAIDATPAGTQHHVVAGGTPVRLLGEIHLKPMAGEEALLHPNHQGGCLENGQEAEADGADLEVGIAVE